MKLSFNLGLVPGVTMMFAADTLDARLALARSHGFTGVEGPVPEAPAAARTRLDAHDMRYASLSFARGDPAHELGIACIPGRERQFRDDLARALDAAVQLSCDLLHPLAGRVPPGVPRAQCWSVYRANLQLACEQAALARKEIIVEPICAARQPAFLLNTLAEAIDLCASIPGAPKIMVDMFHASQSGESTSEFAQAHAESIGMLQVSDAPLRRQPSAQDAELRATVDALHAQGWSGWYSGEYVPEGSLAESLAWTRLLDRAGQKAAA